MQKTSFGDNKSFVYKVTTNELKEIVSIMNKPPFDENYTMVMFDELQGRSLITLLTKIIKLIDSKTEYCLDTNTEENQALVSDLLSILSYPEATDESFLKSVFEGEKKPIQRLLFYLLKNFDEFKQRAYLGQFL